ncbi:hypothetical protein [Rufibacter latericius]|uniref:Uncharacterized protein n=1 Tax=Rufibacter latericius TaxID=2487040 RepID=A0A3M9MMY7_9BACT|nr:hypothetical protein [Rufibacter latericius]RNI26904.1 hypothetical protein EFB08_10535 [Rufibacter latericius]
MEALAFFIDLTRRGGLKEWEQTYLTPKPELLDHEVNLDSKTASYTGFDEHGQLTTILYPLIGMMEQKVKEEQKKTLQAISRHVLNQPRAEQKEYLQDVISLLNHLKEGVSQDSIFQAYSSVSESLEYLTQDLATTYGRLLGENSLETPSEQYISSKSKRGPALVPETFTYTGFGTMSEEEAKEKLKDFAHSLIKQKLISDLAVKTNKVSSRSVIDSIIKIFQGKKLKSSVIWSGTQEELSFLIKQLKGQKLIAKTPCQWKIAASCFIQLDGSRFKEAFLRGAHAPKDPKGVQQAIEQLLYNPS